MKIALMSGAFVNAGDFLIEERCKALLESNIENSHVDIFKRNISYDNKIDLLNSYDMIVFGGGPGFQKNLYPNRMPFVSDLSKITTPIAIMGWGWYGKQCSNTRIYRKRAFTPDMLQFINRVSQKGGYIGCRDWFTVSMLKEQGINNVMMTGCPAWYRVDMIDTLQIQSDNILNNDKPVIVISDAAFPRNIKYMKVLLKTVRIMYPNAYSKVLLHRGITKYNKWLTEEQNQLTLQYTIDVISGSSEGFKQYDTCDIHIGFRVHAHIYNLSMGNPSILISEDARGNGVNDALGLRNVYPDKYLDKQLYDYFDYLGTTGMRQYRQSCEAIKLYYVIMQKYISEVLMV